MTVDLDTAMGEVMTARLTANGIFALWLMGQNVDQELLDARRAYLWACQRRDEAAAEIAPNLAVVPNESA